MSIKLAKLIPLQKLDDYKLHLACWNGHDKPLDVFVRSRDEWEGWNSYRGQRDRFNRKYIYSLIEYYPERNTWLFGGIYEVISSSSSRYQVQLIENLQEFIGRVKIGFARPSRSPSFNLEKYYEDMVVSEILKDCYTGEAFCGYENINHSFCILENIVKNNKPDWKAALTSIKGVYLITDIKNGKRYVGSAYGDSGIWSRWACYIGTGHGWNDDFTKIVAENGIEYARENFVFSLLEYRSMKSDDNTIIERESYWKDVLLTRGKYGYNNN